ncbi:NAD-dependent epimerase/dehydratase family protein [bacterium]|nr:MAG: NAD-dependent epimerase/dehydratase family protein [bacterium]
MRCLVTGALGFIGTFLVDFLLARGALVYGLDKQTKGLSPRMGFHLVQCDLLDRKAVFEVVKEVQPDVVFHLAAQSLPRVSWEDPETTFRVNVFGTLYLLDAIRTAQINPIIEVFCSSGEYAVSQNDTPIGENFPLEPSSPYALSKIAQDQLCLLYGKAYQMCIVRVRPFFIIGPRKTGDVCSDFARGIVAIERGLTNTLTVGNLDAVRDFLDVRDALTAFWLVAERGIPGTVYNICSGQGFAVSDILGRTSALSKTPFEAQQGSSRLHPLDEPVKIGDNTKLMALGWRPSIPIDQSLADILAYWRNQETI